MLTSERDKASLRLQVKHQLSLHPATLQARVLFLSESVPLLSNVMGEYTKRKRHVLKFSCLLSKVMGLVASRLSNALLKVRLRLVDDSRRRPPLLLRVRLCRKRETNLDKGQ